MWNCAVNGVRRAESRSKTAVRAKRSGLAWMACACITPRGPQPTRTVVYRGMNNPLLEHDVAVPPSVTMIPFFCCGHAAAHHCHGKKSAGDRKGNVACLSVLLLLR